MPRENIDYSKTVIYKIVCKDLSNTDCYVGNTTKFTNRKAQHKYSSTAKDYKNYHYQVYQCIRDNGGWDNWDMIEIEKYPCLDGNEACKRERHHYELLNASLNKQVPSRTHQEYDKKYRDDNKEYYQKYRDDPEHKQKMKDYQINYREDKKLIAHFEKLQKENENKLKI